MQTINIKEPFTSGLFSSEEIAAFRKDTEGVSHVLHLNNAGAGLMPRPVLQSMVEHFELEARMGGYEAAALRADAVKEFYVQAAKLFNCKPSNIAFTTSATDSYSRALSSIPFKSGDIILTDNDDFISNQIQFLSLQKRLGIRIEHIRNAPEGGVDLNHLEELLHRLQPRLLAITMIPTNAGLVQPVHQIAAIYEQYEKIHGNRTWYILDACQGAGQRKLDVQELKCDFLSVTSRKFLRGPRGSGFLFISDKALQSGLEPMFIDMRGADWIEKDQYQPREDAMRFEDWEFAYAQVIGTSEAIKYYLQLDDQQVWNQIKHYSDYLRRELSAIDRVRVLDRGPELGGLVTFTVEGSNAQYLMQEMIKRKINIVPSYRKFAVIDFDEKKVEWALRASPHYYNTTEELDTFLDTVKTII